MTSNGEKPIVRTSSDFSPQRGEESMGSSSGLTMAADALFESISQLIKESHARVSSAVNAEMTELYWQIGRVLNEDVMGGERQAYGSQTLESLSQRLTSEYGRGWSAHHLRQCMRLAAVFPDEAILYAVRTKLNWTCIRTVMYIDEPLKRDFYIEMCKLNRWSSRTLQGLNCHRWRCWKKSCAWRLAEREGDWKSRRRICHACT